MKYKKIQILIIPFRITRERSTNSLGLFLSRTHGEYEMFLLAGSISFHFFSLNGQIKPNQIYVHLAAFSAHILDFHEKQQFPGENAWAVLEDINFFSIFDGLLFDGKDFSENSTWKSKKNWVFNEDCFLLSLDSHYLNEFSRGNGEVIYIESIKFATKTTLNSDNLLWWYN